MRVPFVDFHALHSAIESELVDEFKQVLKKGQFILGDKVKEFESKYSDYCGVKYTIGVGNGLDALHLSLEALGIKKGDEVIVPSNTFIATIIAISASNAIPCFVEPKISTYNINPDLIEKAITSKTKAIIPVHLYGQACEMQKIMDIANRNSLFVVEDNAQAQGAVSNKKRTGSFGILNCTSFYPAKNIGALGDAGAITTNDAKLAEKLYTLRNYGSKTKYVNDIIGHNSRLDEKP